MAERIDLRQLSVRRENGQSVSVRPARRRPTHRLTRYVLPGGILLGFVGVLGWAARDHLLSSRAVTVVPVMATRAEVQQAGTPLFQAAGWVEPRPTPVFVTALAEGVIDKLLVVEGQTVKAGEPIAQLVEADARLALEATENDVQQREAEVHAAQAALKAARVHFEQPVQLQAALGESEALLARAENDLQNLPQQLRAARAKHVLAQQHFEAKRRGVMAGALTEIQLQAAPSERDATRAICEELQGREPRLRREVDGQRLRRDALRKRLELKTEETRQLGEAEANVKSAEAKVRQARTAVSAAKLRLERMTVRAPQEGRVLSLIARPGSRLMGLAAGTAQDASTILSLYDPARLQVRADVRFEDVPRVRQGQPVTIETPAAPGAGMDGEVLFTTHQADIQKNTLQVKVAIKNPPATIRPDMLVQVTFLAPPSPVSVKPEERLRLLVPRLLVETGEGGSRVWIADQATGLARLRSVKVGVAVGDLVEITEGLNAADRLISSGRDGLREGERITITGEDAAGLVTAAPGMKTTSPTRLQRSVGGDASGKSGDRKGINAATTP